MPPTQREKADAFKALHDAPGYFVIPNPWDGASARILAALGYKALTTSSGAQAGTYGRRDGMVSRDEAMAHCRMIVEATDLPVAADMEKCYGDDSATCAETIASAAENGLVGGSIEDATGRADQPLFEFEDAVTRVSAAVEAARKLPFHFTLVARTEAFLRGGTPDVDFVIKRLKAFEAAGADVLMAPGLPDLEAVRAVCQSVSKPVNFMVGVPGRSFDVASLAEAGVKRISLATTLYKAAMTGLMAAAKETLEQGTFSYVDTNVPTRDFALMMQAPTAP